MEVSLDYKVKPSVRKEEGGYEGGRVRVIIGRKFFEIPCLP